MRENRVGHANVADVVGHLAQRCEAHAKGHRINRDFGLVKLAHDFRHGPALAVYITHARRSELLAVGVIQRFIIEEAVQERRCARDQCQPQTLATNCNATGL